MNDKEIFEWINSGIESERRLGHVCGKLNTAVHIKYQVVRDVPDIVVAFVPEESEWVVFVADYVDEDCTIKTWKRARLEY